MKTVRVATEDPRGPNVSKVHGNRVYDTERLAFSSLQGTWIPKLSFKGAERLPHSWHEFSGPPGGQRLGLA